MTTVFVVPHQPRHHPITVRFPQLFDLCRTYAATPFANPEAVASPRGTLPHLLLYHLGHDHPLPTPLSLQPDDVRQLRDVAWRARLSDGRVHLFGVVDNAAPVGSRRLVEQSIRLIGSDGLPIVVHLGQWHATPREQAFGRQEIAGLGANVTIGSQFDWSTLYNKESLKKYIAELQKIHDGLPESFQPSPLRHSVHIDASWQPDDHGLVVAHHPVGFGGLVVDMHESAGRKLSSFDQSVPVSDRWRDVSQDLAIFTHDPTYPRYFFGDAIRNTVRPIEDLHQKSETKHTYVFLDDRVAAREAKWIDGIYARRNDPLAVYWLEPFRLDQNVLYTST